MMTIISMCECIVYSHSAFNQPFLDQLSYFYFGFLVVWTVEYDGWTHLLLDVWVDY